MPATQRRSRQLPSRISPPAPKRAEIATMQRCASPGGEGRDSASLEDRFAFLHEGAAAFLVVLARVTVGEKLLAQRDIAVLRLLDELHCHQLDRLHGQGRVLR